MSGPSVGDQTLAEWYATSVWGQPCRNMYRALADAQDHRLLDIVQDRQVADTTRTYAAETAGQLTDSAQVVPVLSACLSSDSLLMREGAVYGLSQHWHAPGVPDLLAARFEVEQSSGVRQAIEEALAEHGEEHAASPAAGELAAG